MGSLLLEILMLKLQDACKCVSKNNRFCAYLNLIHRARLRLHFLDIRVAPDVFIADNNLFFVAELGTHCFEGIAYLCDLRFSISQYTVCSQVVDIGCRCAQIHC